MPRLVLYTSAFPQLSETFIVQKFLGLLQRGWDVHLLTAQVDAQAWKHYPQLSQPAIRSRVHAAWPHRPRWLALLLLPFAMLRCLARNPRGVWRYARLALKRWGLAKALRRFYLDSSFISLKPHLVHFEFGTLAVEQADLGQLLGCKVVVSFRGYDLNFAGLEQPDYYRQVWQHADGLHLLGEDLWQRAQRRGCPTKICHALIPPAVDAERLIPAQRKDGGEVGTAYRPLRLLSVGRLEWKKGYEYGLQAVDWLRQAGIACDYRIVGGGSYLEPLAFTRHQLGLVESVTFMRGLQHAQVMEQLAWADVFLHAAVSEGFCNAVMEAQAMQVPVVCTDADGLAENVVDGESGFVVPRRNPQALAQRIQELAHDGSLRQRMGQAGRERVLSCFRLSDLLDRFEAFYQQVLHAAH